MSQRPDPKCASFFFIILACCRFPLQRISPSMPTIFKIRRRLFYLNSATDMSHGLWPAEDSVSS